MSRTAILVCFVALAMIASAVEPSPTQLATSPPGNVGVEMGQLFLRESTDRANARVYIGAGDRSFSVGLNSQNQFSVATNKGGADKDVLVVNEDNVAVASLLARTVTADSLILGGIPQWQLVREDTFAAPAASFLENDAPTSSNEKHGWTNNPVIECQGLGILTVDDGKLPVEKTFGSLPAHSHVRVQATVHFIDDWQGESAFLRIGDHYVWTGSHDQRNAQRSMSVCGSAIYPESKFTETIDVTVPNPNDSVKLTFGSTLESGSQGKFGVSSVSISVRNTKPAVSGNLDLTAEQVQALFNSAANTPGLAAAAAASVGV